jgi:hypothetical protein
MMIRNMISLNVQDELTSVLQCSARVYGQHAADGYAAWRSPGRHSTRSHLVLAVEYA